ncbi:MAG: hypothetical protein L6437_02870 [Kiritimatiellae bacterium]|nr:hypothetical protein [Kiritimatiellia bacterium]
MKLTLTSILICISFFSALAAQLAGGRRYLTLIFFGIFLQIGKAELSAPTNVRASDWTYSDKVLVTWDAVESATGYVVSRAPYEYDSGGTGSVDGLWQTGTNYFADTNAVAVTSYVYRAAATDALSTTGSWSAADAGGRASWIADFSGAKVLFIDNSNTLWKIVGDGIITNVFTPPVGVSSIYKSQTNYIAIGFQATQQLPPVQPGFREAILVRFDINDNSLVGVGGSAGPAAVLLQVCFDRFGNIFYGGAALGFQGFKRWSYPTNEVAYINDNISVGTWFVNYNDGYVLMSGNTISTGDQWLRTISPELNVRNIYLGWYALYLMPGLYPDNLWYVMLSAGTFGQYYGLYRFPSDFSQMTSLDDLTLILRDWWPEGLFAARTASRTFAWTKKVNYFYQILPALKTNYLTSLDLITCFDGASNVLAMAGTYQGNYRLILYDPDTGGEVRLLDENIEIYHLKTMYDGNIWFDGLKLNRNKYIIGKVQWGYAPGLGFYAKQSGYTELATLSGKPLDMVKLGTEVWNPSADPSPDPSPDPVVRPVIKANGTADNVIVNYPETVSITVELNAGDYAGTNVDWWVVAFAHSGQLYYLNSAMQWTPFSGDPAFCQPAYQGPLFNLSSRTVLNKYTLQRGTYDFWFAVDYPMDGILNYPDGTILYDKVTLVVE